MAQDRYYQRFSTVETNSTFYNLPRLPTAERWRQESPQDFVFCVKAWQLITHPRSSPTYERLKTRMSEKELSRCGHFKSSAEVMSAWERTQEIARVLKARFVLFQTPASFYPNADHLRDMYRFFKGLKREGVSLVWEPRGESWEPAMVSKICADLSLIHGVDPMIAEPMRGAVRYYRLHGRHERGKIVYGHEYSDAELRHILSRCEGHSAYVYFNNVSMWRDAERFDGLVHPENQRQRLGYVRHLRTF